MIELCCEYLSVRCIHYRVWIHSETRTWLQINLSEYDLVNIKHISEYDSEIYSRNANKTSILDGNR